MRWTTLTIEIDRGFLGKPIVTGGRVRRFLNRAFARDVEERVFRPSWEGKELAASRDGDTLVLNSPDLDQWARTGDRLWLQAAVGGPGGIATLYDGAAAMVQHFMSRADPEFAARLSSDGLPDADSAVIGSGQYRAEWGRLLEQAVDLGSEYEARTTASLAALINLGAESGTEVALLTRDEAVHPAWGVLDQMLASARAGRIEREERVILEPRRYDLEPTRDTPRLLAMAEAVTDAFADQASAAYARSAKIGDLLRAIAAGNPATGGE